MDIVAVLAALEQGVAAVVRVSASRGPAADTGVAAAGGWQIGLRRWVTAERHATMRR